VQTIVVAGVLGELYSDDGGKTYQPSTGGGTSQNVRYLGTNGDGGLKFGVAGQYFNTNGGSPPLLPLVYVVTRRALTLSSLPASLFPRCWCEC
jgi:hypothetical protein